MTGYRTITLTLPEEIVAAAEADVASGFAASLEAWFLGSHQSDLLVCEAERRLADVRTGRAETIEVSELKARLAAFRAEAATR